MALKNQTLNVIIWALNIETNLGQSGLAPTMQLKGIGDGTEYDLGVSPVEVDASLLPGMYSVNLPASATNYNFISVGGISTNPDVVIVPVSFATERGYLDALTTTLNVVSADTSEISALATTEEISAGCILAIQNQFTFSGDAVYSYGMSASVNAAEVAAAVLATVVDSKTFEEVLEILIAMATGKITRVNNKFTYYKQDNSTELYTLESARDERTRL